MTGQMHRQRMLLRRLLRRLIALAALALLPVASAGLAAENADPPFPEPNPALFVARDSDTTIYVLGTIHIVPCVPEAEPPVCATGLTPPILQALGAAEEVWMEVADIADLVEDPSSVMRLALFQNGEHLSDYVPREDIETIAAALSASFGGSGIEAIIAAIDMMQPWIVSMLVATSDIAIDGAWGDGVDVEVARAAGEFGLPIFGFETAEEQMAILASDPLDYQVADLRSLAVLLRHNIDWAALNAEVLTEMWGVWSEGRMEDFSILMHGDTDLAAELTDADIAAALGLSEAEYLRVETEIEAFYPEAMQEERAGFYDQLVGQRNLNWMADIQGMLDRPGTFFIAVGAAHLVGDEGLPALLTAAGATVERVE